MKKIIRKVAAVGAGVVMLGSTLGGAVAVSMDDMSGTFGVASTAYVVGSDAGTNDDSARDVLANYFGGFVDVESGAVVSTSDVEKLYIGGNIMDQFSTSLDDGDLNALWDDAITFEGESYETHEEINVTANVYIDASTIGNEEKLSSDVALYTNSTNAWGYRYVFDEAFSDNISTTDALDISFLGKTISITDVDDNSGNDGITISTSVDYSLGQDSSVVVGAHTVYVGTIFSESVEIWVDGEAHKFMSTDEQETFNIGSDQVEVEVDQIGYTDDIASRTVLIKTGEDITTSVDNGDAVQIELGEPDVDDKAADAVWNWDISFAADDVIAAGDYIGISYYPKVNKYDDEPTPLFNEGNYLTPYGYVSLDATLSEPAYNSYSMVFEDSYTINSTVEQSYIVLFEAEDSSSNEGFIYDGTDTSRVACNATGACWYEDDDGDWAYSSTIVDDATTFRIESGTNTDKYIRFFNSSATGTFVSGDTIAHINIEDAESGDEGRLTSGMIEFNLTIASKMLGNTVDDADSGDLVYYDGTTRWSGGTWDEGDFRTPYGTIFVNPEENSDNNELRFEVPEKEIYMDVSFNVRSTATEFEAVLKTEAGAAGYDALILVGGPCVNTLTADYLGLPVNSCEADSGIAADAALVELVEKDGKTALIVAGYEKADTLRAANAVAAGGLTGTSMIV